ncbi:DNA polymerase III subunit beta [Oceanobacillus profundus]|uniref:DNA polymerase III subunit beta n=1 Tax=Oceanobacillus TaxID=182709 RepID=UPI00203ADA7B|nr:DNA polymerase III subunit beta [Oceanobacillus profundus]MCM3398066.1 DNA polymerase III subunit beta [Oceanobacillus profundus]MDO6448022.1 DNA polymerase III subunit beta [Oceanobacillus profundus]
MKFIIKRDRLIAGIQDVMKAISSRTVIPILTGMKIEAKQHGITLTGSDSDISIESYIPAEEDDMVYVEQIEEGSIVLQAKYFPDIIRKLPENTVEIEVDSNLKVTIRSGKAEFNLNGQDAEEYPLLPKLQTDDSFEMPIDLLKSMIKQTVFAVSTMETRPILTGVNLKLVDKVLSFTATDSHRLAKREIPVADANIAFQQVVVPGKSLNELYKILDDTEETVEISVTNNQILFRTKHLNFLSRLLDGNYPETSRLIPEQSKTKIQVKTKELLNTIDRASLLAKEERNNVVRLFTPNDSVIEISSNSPEVGNVVEEIGIQAMEGEELKISFSSKYMIDALKAIEYDEVIIEFTGAMRPFVIHPLNEDSILQLILPVRTF